MARTTANIVSPRRIVAGVFVFVGLFAMCFGFGNRSQALIVTGAAVMVLSFSVRLFSSWRRNPRQWVLGTGHVTEVSDPPPDARYGRCTLQLVVDAPGLPAETVLVNDPRVPVAQWPYPGLELPIEVAADDPRSIRIRWRQVPIRENPFDDLDTTDSHEFPPEYGEGPDRPYGPDPYLAEPPLVGPEPPLVAPEPPVPAPRAAVIDFDLDQPPAADPADPADAADPGSRPAVAPLPPELGTLDEFGVPGAAPSPEVPADAPAEAEPVAGGEPALPEVPRPRRRPPRPYPVAPPPEVPEPAVPDPVSAEPEPVAEHEPLLLDEEPLPEPELAGAAAATYASIDAASNDRAGSLVDELVTAYPSAYPGPSGAINNVGITVLVTDLDRATEFYRDQLGFYEVDGGEGNTVLASGETRLVLRAVPGLKPIRHRSVYLNLEVSDLEAVYAELKTSGVKFTNAPRPVNRTARLELWAATFRDPDGHGIALTQWRPAPEPTRTPTPAPASVESGSAG